jgi:hypothetical protein
LAPLSQWASSDWMWLATTSWIITNKCLWILRSNAFHCFFSKSSILISQARWNWWWALWRM